jgi:hypothetical protein
MRRLIIKNVESCPTVILDKESGKFEIFGNSLPEDVHTFYTPVFDWIRDYIKQPNAKTELVIKLMYFNSASTKAIIDILTILEELVINGHDVKILWNYFEIDEDMLSTGKELASILNIPFDFIPFTDGWVRLAEER